MSKSPALIISLFTIILVLLGFSFFLLTKTTNAPTIPTTQQTATQNVSPSPKTNTQLANPASVNCVKVGGTVSIQNGPNGQYGLCQFEDNYACEEWALFRGQCPKGGVRTTGFDNIAQKYCAWVGGQTLAVKDAKCTLPSGKVCSDEALYKGTCNP
jgi:putative hemolysin